MKKLLPLFVVAVALLSGCATAPDQTQTGLYTRDRLTVAVIQREVKVGMTDADVRKVLGTPDGVLPYAPDIWGDNKSNVTTGGIKLDQSWIYDNRDAVPEGGYSLSFGNFIQVNDGSLGPENTQHRTLRVVVKFDDQQHVRDCDFLSSEFAQLVK